MKLVIVESPAKAKTIRNYLGDEYVVEASVGHVRDLPTPSALPKNMKNGPYSKFAVNVDKGFKPYYHVHPDKRKRVSELRKALKEADELYLATDEDREGEAIAWHLLEVLKPTVPVKRMVFHEITKEAITQALENTREIDYDLVDAQETRRVLDRLFGYEVSPVLWRKVAPALSAGRVQSVATRLIVDREKDRMAFVSAGYWSIMAQVEAVEADEETQDFQVRVVELDGRPVASSADFGDDGKRTPRAEKANALVLNSETASKVRNALPGATGEVQEISRKPYRRRPGAPFTTSTLQQEASRRLKWNAATTMRVAQSLYESGHITYMRTDSTVLSGQALHAARDAAKLRFGADSIPASPRFYGKQAKGAQEAHEAIRPSGEKFVSPEAIASSITPQQLALYRLIYQRTVASQMNDATGFTATVKVQVPLDKAAAGFSNALATTSGTVIVDPGFRALYMEAKTGKAKKAKVEEQDLPQVEQGDKVRVLDAETKDHRTTPPGRFTEASLVKAMEDLGIGRPSTYAATIQTIGDRGYITHRGQYLVPTWLAFSVTRLLVENLSELVDYQFTAQMESDLDQIAAGEREGADWLQAFYFGGLGKEDAERAAAAAGVDVEAVLVEEGTPGGDLAQIAVTDTPIATSGLKHTVENLVDIDAREVNSIHIAPGVVLRIGRYGPYLQTDDEVRVSVPPTIAPDEMTLEVAEELLRVGRLDGKELGKHPETGNMIIVKTGRFGPYFTEVLPDMFDDKGKKIPKTKMPKPKTASLFKEMDMETVTLDDAVKLMALPRDVGADPESGEMITAQNGPYGPYLRKGRDTRQLPSEESLLTVTLEEALQLYAQPKRRGRGARANLREFGADPISGRPVVVKDGRFGPYVTDGQTNASVPRSETVEGLTEERAQALLADRRDKAPAKRKPRRTTARKTTARKTTARKTTARKTTRKTTR